jgi:hypothetical protein
MRYVRLWPFALLLMVLCLLALSMHKLTGTNKYPELPSPASLTMSHTPTRWWIMTTSPNSIQASATTALSPTQDGKCPTPIQSKLRAGIYTFVSLNPPLPNRLHSKPGRAELFVGQLEPGETMRILSGPVCTEGHVWWLVEKADDSLRGWTAEGYLHQPWILPCPNEGVACRQVQLTPTAEMGVHEPEDECPTHNISRDQTAWVRRDDILVIRVAPEDGQISGYAGPLTQVKITGGPVCQGQRIWWQLQAIELNLSGWGTDTSLQRCASEDGCGP